MNGESTYKPNFTVIDDEPTSEPKPKKENNKTSNDNADFAFNSSEENLIKKKRHKLRIFDPEGIYTFRHIEIGYFHSFLHAISALISLFLIISYYRLSITETQQLVPGVGYISDLNVLDKLCMTFIALYGVIKVKSVFNVKVTPFNKRYRLALCANAFNRFVLNYLKLIVAFLVFQFLIIQVKYLDLTVGEALELTLNGTMTDTISIITWFISIIIVVKAFKYCGKGENK